MIPPVRVSDRHVDGGGGSAPHVQDQVVRREW